MRGHYPHAGLRQLCGLFGKTRQAFYNYQNHREDQLLQEGFILDYVKEIRRDMPRIGTVKLHFMLNPLLAEHDISIGRDRFCTLLKAHNLLVKHPKRYHVKTTDSNHPYFKWPSLIEGWTPRKPHQLWVSDITYLRTNGGFLYLSLITDAWSRKIIGHHLSHSLKARGCVSALQKAIGQLPEGAGVIHHSDRGIQYCCQEYVTILQDNKISISMTQNGSPYENAKAERVNGILKTELGLNVTFSGYQDALRATSCAIDTYNRKRPHMSCNMRTPKDAHLDGETFSKQPINPKQPGKKTASYLRNRSTGVKSG